jgi:hypothetical protein
MRACLGAYNLYSLDDKPVADLVLIDITQKRTLDMRATSRSWFMGTLLLISFAPVAVLVLGAVDVASAILAAKQEIKASINPEQADLFLFKTLEHHGLVRLLDNNQIELLNC